MIYNYISAHLIGRGLLSIRCCCHRSAELWLAVRVGGVGVLVLLVLQEVKVLRKKKEKNIVSINCQRFIYC